MKALRYSKFNEFALLPDFFSPLPFVGEVVLWIRAIKKESSICHCEKCKNEAISAGAMSKLIYVYLYDRGLRIIIVTYRQSCISILSIILIYFPVQ